jgi:DNA (cytosine-5)-methyltransferase 1
MKTETSFNNFFERGQIIHCSLFSGIGGFDLAAEWLGWINRFQVEKNEWCKKVLQKNFKSTIRYGDIKETDFSQWKRKITVLTGGFPCQPVSIAGKRKGSDDERFLWGEMYRAIKQIEPPFVVAENVTGLLTQEQGILFKQVYADLESIGYEIQSFIVPACGINAPHKRERVWIIAYSDSFRQQNEQEKSGQTLYNGKRNDTIEEQSWEQQQCGACKSNSVSANLQSSEQKQSRHTRTGRNGFTNIYSDATNPERIRQQGQRKYRGWSSSKANEEREADWFINGNQFQREWVEVASELCRVDDGLPKGLDRSKRLEGIGNAVVPQVAYQILLPIDLFLKGEEKKLLKIETECSIEARV